MDLFNKAKEAAKAAQEAAAEQAASLGAKAAQTIRENQDMVSVSTPRSLIRNIAGGSEDAGSPVVGTLEILTPDGLEAEVERWKARAGSLEVRVKAATEARKEWQMQVAISRTPDLAHVPKCDHMYVPCHI